MTKSVALLIVVVSFLCSDLTFAQNPRAQDQRVKNPREWEIITRGQIFDTLQDAFDAVEDGGVIRIGPGVYRQAGVLKKNNVIIIGSKGTHFVGTIAEGKATFIFRGQGTTLKNVECSGAKARDNNGACIRFEGYNLLLDSVYFHDSQSGILSAKGDRGHVEIKNSRFEQIGKVGRAHPIYMGGGRLTLKYSTIVTTVDQAHGVKSRASETILIGNVIASMDGNDSRLVDIPNGGKVILRNNLFVEGPKTANWEILSWGVEGLRPFKEHSFLMENNMVVSDRMNGSVLLGMKDNGLPRPTISGNMLVGFFKKSIPTGNKVVKSRSEFGFADHPALPFWPGAARAIKNHRTFEAAKR